MMNFGILITNYENPIVMTRGDIFKRFMFTSYIIGDFSEKTSNEKNTKGFQTRKY